MKPYANITCAVLTPEDTASQKWGQAILTMLTRHPLAVPTSVGNYEPIREQCGDIGAAMKFWSDPFLWKSSASKTEGSIWFGRGKKHSCLYLERKLRRDLFGQKAWVEFLEDSCNTLDADLGYIHLTTDQEFGDPDIPHGCTYSIDIGFTTHELVKGIPNLCWAMVFGGHYQSIADRFRNSTVTEVRELSDGRVYVQLTDSLLDILDNYASFKDVRAKVKSKIGEDFLAWERQATWRPAFTFGLANKS